MSEDEAMTSAMTTEQFHAYMKTLPPPPDVFMFDGTMADFRAALEADGVEVRAPAPAPAGMPCWPFPLLGWLGCYEVDGKVWVAARHRDVDDAMAGRLPFRRIGGK